MREILFRARIKRAKCFCYSTVGTEYFPSFLYNLNTNPDDYVIMQYTGRKDKNGKKIFEGDVCEVEYLGEYYRGQVDFKNGGFWIVKHNGYGGVGYFISDIYDDTMREQGIIEIIGDKFSNPELLEGK